MILVSLVVPAAAVAVWLLTGGRGVSHRTANLARERRQRA